jgi:hypothetical protein
MSVAFCICLKEFVEGKDCGPRLSQSIKRILVRDLQGPSTVVGESNVDNGGMGVVVAEDKVAKLSTLCGFVSRVKVKSKMKRTLLGGRGLSASGQLA